MAQIMQPEIFDPNPPARTQECERDVFRADMGTGRKHSIRALVTVLGKNRNESLTSEIIQPNDAPVAILGLWKHNPLAVAVNIQPTQGEYFGAAHPRRDEQGHDGAQPHGAGFKYCVQLCWLKVTEPSSTILRGLGAMRVIDGDQLPRHSTVEQVF